MRTGLVILMLPFAAHVVACSLLFDDVAQLSGRPPEAATPDAGGPDGGDGDAQALSYRAEVLADRPVAYFRLEEESGTEAKDEIGGAPATLVAARLGVAGVAGSRAVELDGTSSHIDLGQRYAVAGNQAVTFELWVEPRGVDDTFRRILSNETDGTGAARQGWSVSIESTNGLSVQRFRDGVADTVGLPPSAFGPASLHHLVIAYDGSELLVYVDGVMEKQAPATKPMIDTGRPVTLGKPGTFGGPRLAGVFDEVAVYDRALAGDRVRAHYDAAKR